MSEPAAHTPPTVGTLPQPELRRGLSTGAALSVNIIDMVGVGPFVTLPLIVGAMGGPQAILGWLLGAILSMCDGLIWSELGTAYPEAGGSYAYLKHLYGKRAGRALAFLYAWQLLFSAPLSIASGCLGFAQYATYFLPRGIAQGFTATWFHVPVVLSAQTLLAMTLCLVAAVVLQRDLRSLDRIMKAVGLAVVAVLVWIIITGFTHFNAGQAFSFPPGAFHLNHAFLVGLGSGMLIAAYDYWGYYNICFLGSEVRDPQRTIPRAVLGAIAIVGTLYLLMNVSVLGVVPWREFTGGGGGTRVFTVPMAGLMRHAYPGPHGQYAAAVVVALIAFAAAASVLALLLGYSRIPYAAARDSNFPAMFGHVDPRHNIPHVSLRVLAGMTMVCCLFRLQEVISTLVVIRILFQFLLQGTAVLLPRYRRARRTHAFRMPLYPLPVLLALSGFLFILLARPHFLREIRAAAVILFAGAVVYGLRLRRASAGIAAH